MKKTLLTTAIILTLVFALTACGKKEEPTATPTATPSATPATNPDDSEPTKTPESEPTKAPEENTAATMGQELLAIFKQEIEGNKDLASVCDKIIGAKVLEEVGCGTMEVEPGFLNGFSADITGFTKGQQFGPFIGSIPFIGYVFEATDAEALKADLLSKADPRWNICTAAEETVCEVVGNYVFFTMCPGADF